MNKEESRLEKKAIRLHDFAVKNNFKAAGKFTSTEVIEAIAAKHGDFSKQHREAMLNRIKYFDSIASSMYK